MTDDAGRESGVWICGGCHRVWPADRWPTDSGLHHHHACGDAGSAIFVPEAFISEGGKGGLRTLVGELEETQLQAVLTEANAIMRREPAAE